MTVFQIVPRCAVFLAISCATTSSAPASSVEPDPIVAESASVESVEGMSLLPTRESRMPPPEPTPRFCTPARLWIGLVLYCAAAWAGRQFLLPLFVSPTAATAASSSSLATPLVDVFPGAPWRTSQTVDSTLVLSDSRIRVEKHTVRGEDGKLYKDWWWMDVVDQINVMPYVLDPPPAEPTLAAAWNRWKHGSFIAFRQKKYGLAGDRAYLAVAGGQVEMAKQEAPLAAAQRELREELFLRSADDRPEDWVDLGSYRVNVNRGHGTVSCFLLLDAQPTADAAGQSAEFKVDELERQAVVRLTADELETALRNHEFGEIKWAATAAMALAEVRRRIAQEDERLQTLLMPLAALNAPNRRKKGGAARPAAITKKHPKRAKRQAEKRP